MRISDWSSDGCSADLLVHLGGASPWVLQLCLAVLTLLFSQVMSNVGATVMMVPIAISVAVATGGNPAAYALIIAVKSEEHTSELQSLMRNSYAVFCLKKKNNTKTKNIVI